MCGHRLADKPVAGEHSFVQVMSPESRVLWYKQLYEAGFYDASDSPTYLNCGFFYNADEAWVVEEFKRHFDPLKPDKVRIAVFDKLTGTQKRQAILIEETTAATTGATFIAGVSLSPDESHFYVYGQQEIDDQGFPGVGVPFFTKYSSTTFAQVEARFDSSPQTTVNDQIAELVDNGVFVVSMALRYRYTNSAVDEFPLSFLTYSVNSDDTLSFSHKVELYPGHRPHTDPYTINYKPSLASYYGS